MKTEWIHGTCGYDIPCRLVAPESDSIVLVCHGFGSSKDSLMVQALMQKLPQKGFGICAFDFPAHGDSPGGPETLRIGNCLDDLKQVEKWLRENYPGVRILRFGSSFGAYITLLYLAQCEEGPEHAFLRSSAVTMPELVGQWKTPDNQKKLEEQGYFVPDYDYVREMRITPAFLKDLEEHDAFRKYADRKTEHEICMVHGCKDSTAPFDAAQKFAVKFGAVLHPFPEGEHPLMGEGELDRVLELAEDFFRSAGVL